MNSMQRFFQSWLALAMVAGACGSAPLTTSAAASASDVTPAGTPVAPVINGPAQPFSLSQVRLLPGPFNDAMERDQKYLLFLEPDRLLRNFRLNVGLPVTVAPYGGWEAPTSELRGHSLGHYLSALSLMYASTGDPQYKQRVDYIVAQLAICQDASPAAGFHPGYLSAFPESFIDRVETRKAVWAPWYTLHKILAGLYDASQLCGNRQALAVAEHMTDWVAFRVDHLTTAQMQASLQEEQGGMTEVLANLYSATGNTNDLRLAQAFNHQQVIQPLAAKQDQLDRLHANTQIPKIIGAAREYEMTGNPEYADVANFFWDRVALHRSYVIGDHSDREHFFPVDDFAKHLSAETCETCNEYNMLKLTRHLFSWSPDAVKMDFYERSLYNDILASQDPDEGMFVYLMSLKPGHFKNYSKPVDSFWCCVGTGMENHAKYGDTIFFHDDHSLYLNLFIASELTWREQNLVVRQETSFPQTDTTRLTIHGTSAGPLALKVRWPAWAQTPITVRVNGKKQTITGTPGSYVTIDRPWRDGDRVDIKLPMTLHTEPLPGTTNIVALLYGPIVLAGDLGTNNIPNQYVSNQTQYSRSADPAVPVFVSDSADLLKHVRPTSTPLVFQTRNLGQPGDVRLIPFYQAAHIRYSVYWTLLTRAEWSQKNTRADAGSALPARLN
jgi:DUF1680 family protein